MLLFTFILSLLLLLCNVFYNSLLNVKGVKIVTWDIPSNVLSVIYNAKKQDLYAIHEAIAAAGHDTDRAKALDDVYSSLPLCCLYEREQ